MSLEKVTVTQAQKMIAEGAVLVDIREADEYAREHIPGAQHVPLSKIEQDQSNRFGEGQVVLFHCRSGARTAAASGKLRDIAQCDAFVVEGGLDSWKQAGLPVAVDRKQPLPLMQQVQIGAGGLTVLGVVLGFAVSPYFFLLSGFVGAGLLQAGITGWCGMARMLKLMPWNKHAAA